MFAQMLASDDNDVAAIYPHYGRDRKPLQSRIDEVLWQMKTGNSSRPVFSPSLWKWIQDAWWRGSLKHGATMIHTGHLFYCLVRRRRRYTQKTLPELEDFSVEELDRELADALTVSREEYELAPQQTGRK